MDQEEYNIKHFDPKKIANGSICVFIGKRKTGKTTLMKDLLYHKKQIPIGTVISATDHVNESFSSFVPGSFVKKDFRPEIILDIFRKQEEKINHLQKIYKKYYPDLTSKQIYEQHIATNVKNYVFVTLDDVLSDAKNWKNTQVIKQIFFEGRHFLVFFLLSMHFTKGIGPDLRNNIDYIFLTFQNSNDEIEKIYKCFGGYFTSLNSFKTILNSCTEDYNCLVIDNSTNSKKFSDQVFYYRAKEYNDFAMCCKNNSINCDHSECSAWIYHKKIQNYKKPNTVVNQRNRRKVIINKY